MIFQKEAIKFKYTVHIIYTVSTFWKILQRRGAREEIKESLVLKHISRGTQRNIFRKTFTKAFPSEVRDTTEHYVLLNDKLRRF